MTSNDEVGQLVGYFNSYMAQLERYNKDIIRYKTLTKQLMDIADSARQRIGQDLHDDLCPHLIGVQGLSAVLEANLKEEQSNHASLAGNIVDLMDQSIEKSRILARGACPVHLEKHGLPAALEDMTIKFPSLPAFPSITQSMKGSLFLAVLRQLISTTLLKKRL